MLMLRKKFLMCYNQKMFCLFWYNEKIFYMGHISHLDDLILQSIYVLLCLCTVELLDLLIFTKFGMHMYM